MTHRIKRTISVLLLLCMVLSLLTFPADATGKSTGYIKAEDVVYVTSGKYIANWGARDEDCTFLSPNGEDFYTGSNTFKKLSALDGGTGISDAYKSELFQALQSLMKSNHTHITDYQETRPLYCYTDCELSDTKHISSFYSGKELSGTWDSGKTWNREHTWPNSKGLGGSDENDIMMLRPTSVSENSSRGNTAYGESSGYYDPNKMGMDVRGDCARIALYTYVRWGNRQFMWGSGGVIENLDILLKWMSEDPVDTWEMGRNDAVESITGTRNVFIDYPEFAWLLFGKKLPTTVTTPSGEAKHFSSNSSNNNNNNNTTTKPTKPTKPVEPEPPKPTVCPHSNTEVRDAKAATCTETGSTGDTVCIACGVIVTKSETIPVLTHREILVNQIDPSCEKSGYSGDTVCGDCGKKFSQGLIVPAIGFHTWGDWTVISEATADATGLKSRNCELCGVAEISEIPKEEPPTQPTTPVAKPQEPVNDPNWLIIGLIAGAVCIIAVGTTLTVIVLKKRKQNNI